MKWPHLAAWWHRCTRLESCRIDPLGGRDHAVWLRGHGRVSRTGRLPSGTRPSPTSGSARPSSTGLHAKPTSSRPEPSHSVSPAPPPSGRPPRPDLSVDRNVDGQAPIKVPARSHACQGTRPGGLVRHTLPVLDSRPLHLDRSAPGQPENVTRSRGHGNSCEWPGMLLASLDQALKSGGGPASAGPGGCYVTLWRCSCRW